MDKEDKKSRDDSREIEKARHTLDRSMDGLMKSGLVPYEGKWLSNEEYRQRNDQDRRRARVHFVELMLVNFLMMFVSAVLILLVWLISY